MKLRELYDLLVKGIMAEDYQKIKSEPLDGFHRTVETFVGELLLIGRVEWDDIIGCLELQPSNPKHQPLGIADMLYLLPGDQLVVSPGAPFSNRVLTQACMASVRSVRDGEVVCDPDLILKPESATYVVKVSHAVKWSPKPIRDL